MSFPLELSNRSKSAIKVELHTELQAVLSIWGYPVREYYSIEQINELIQKISTSSSQEHTQKEALALEKLRCALMQAVAKHLKNIYVNNKKNSEPTTDNQQSSLLRKKVLFWALVILQFIPNVIGGFLGIKDMLILIPGIPGLIVNAASLIICGIESILFYAMMSPLFRRALGMPEGVDTNIFVLYYSEQLAATKEINELLTKEVQCSDNIPFELLEEYQNFAKQCNQAINQIHRNLPPYQESAYKKGIRFSFAIVNQVLTAAWVYYMVNALLLVFAAPLVGTPIGWGIMGILILGQLAANFALRSDGMFYFLNGKAKKHHELKDGLEKFEDKSEDLEKIYDKRQKQELPKEMELPNEKDNVIECHPSPLRSLAEKRITPTIVEEFQTALVI